MIALVALGIAVVTWIWYLAMIPRGRVPVRPSRELALMAAAVGLAVFGMAGGGWPVVPGLIGLLLGGYFWFLIGTSTLPPGSITVSVGDRLPRFQTFTEAGELVDSEVWSGKRLLLKFFRGQW